MIELWKVIPELDMYEISNMGKIKSKRKNKLMNLVEDSDGYLIICLHQNKKQFNKKVHRLIIEAFNGKSELEVNHKDGNKKNNKLDNLEYCTMMQNQQHAWSTGLRKAKSGKDSHYAKLTEDQVRHIRELLIMDLSQASIARNFGISQSTVYKIKHKQIWKNLK